MSLYRAIERLRAATAAKGSGHNPLVHVRVEDLARLLQEHDRLDGILRAKYPPSE